MARGKRRPPKPLQTYDALGQKRVKNQESPESIMRLSPRWLFRDLDLDHEKWSFLLCENIRDHIFKKLGDYETMTWSEILSASGGKKKGRGTNNHHIPVEDLCSSAQKRLIELGMQDVDKVISLRVIGTKRIIGIRYGSDVRLLWFDPKHEVSPMKEK